MGVLTYDARLTATFPDPTLAHLQAVIWAKLRRNEQFSFTWLPEQGDAGRVSVWVNPSTSLSFEYDSPEPVALDPAWIDELRRSANSAGGLQVLPKPAAR